MPPRHVLCGCAARPYPGLPITGDRSVLVEYARGALVAAIDGLGHGFEAEKAARAAAEVLQANAERPVEELIALCHEALSATRGAAISLASVDRDRRSLRWAGVGNVAALLLRPRAAGRNRLVLRPMPGVVGYRAVRARPENHAIEEGDLLVLASDGIASGFEQAVDPARDPSLLANELLARFARKDDDALVVVARLLPPLSITNTTNPG